MLDHFFYSALGGILIGLSVSLFLLNTGRVMGISGLVSQFLFAGPFQNKSIPMWFLGGLLLGGGSYTLLSIQVTPFPADRPLLMLIVSGLLVGYGTRLGNGCTSGHGVCGMARLSPRSIAATGVFMLFAMMTVFLTK